MVSRHVSYCVLKGGTCAVLVVVPLWSDVSASHLAERRCGYGDLEGRVGIEEDLTEGLAQLLLENSPGVSGIERVHLLHATQHGHTPIGEGHKEA